MPVIETIQAEVEEIEDSFWGQTPSKDQIGRIYQLRRDLLRLRNAAIPLVEVCRRLEKPGLPGIDAAMSPLFRDVSDHIRQVQEEIESLREVLSFTFETSLMTGQAQQNEITRKLAAWAAILAVPTAVAGLYGMNFDVLPELHWKYGYPFVLRDHRWFVDGCTGASARSSGSRLTAAVLYAAFIFETPLPNRDLMGLDVAFGTLNRVLSCPTLSISSPALGSLR